MNDPMRVRQPAKTEPDIPVYRSPIVVGAAVLLVVLIVVAVVRSNRSTASSTPHSSFKAQLQSGQQAKRYSRDASTFLALPVPSEVSEGDWLYFGESTDNVVSLPEKSTVRFGPGSSVTLSSLRQGKDGKYQVKLDLAQGRMWIQSTARHDFDISAKEAVIRSHPGATFEVTVDTDSKMYQVTTVKVYSGSVEFGGRAKGSDKIPVNAGETAKVNEEKLFPAEPFDVAKNDAWETWNQSWNDDQKTAAAAPAATTEAAPPPANPGTAAAPPVGAPGSAPAPPPAAPPSGVVAPPPGNVPTAQPQPGSIPTRSTRPMQPRPGEFPPGYVPPQPNSNPGATAYPPPPAASPVVRPSVPQHTPGLPDPVYGAPSPNANGSQPPPQPTSGGPPPQGGYTPPPNTGSSGGSGPSNNRNPLDATPTQGNSGIPGL